MSFDRHHLRWNGWGRVSDTFDLGEHEDEVWDWLRGAVGLDAFADRTACAITDVSMAKPRLPDEVLSRLRAIVGEGGLKADDYERVFHARGRSYPDLLALRSGQVDPAPDAVVYPGSEAQVVELVALADEHKFALVPFGGGTSVVGGVSALAGPDHCGVVTLDTTRLDRVLSIDEESLTARVQAGIYGPVLEQKLQARGFTLGHYPQSFEFSTLGGWIAARGAGQQSGRYGKAEEWLVSANVATPRGLWTTEGFPASAAGPSVGHLIAGGEGTLGIITEATVAICRVPEETDYRGYLFREFADAVSATREIMQQGLPVAMVRVSDADESHFLQRFSHLRKPPGRVQRVADDLLERTGWGEGRAMMLVGIEGERENVRAAHSRTSAIVRRHRAFPLGQSPGQSWYRGRFALPYLRDPLLDRGVAVDTLETSTEWANIHALHDKVINAIRGELDRQRASAAARAMVMCHVSHCYADGASLYFTFMFPQKADGALEQWKAVKHAACEAIVDGGGTISHHHGVGTDHAPWLRKEKGEIGYRLLQAIKNDLDPNDVLNPGKLLTRTRSDS